jgi:hypothetical protein
MKNNATVLGMLKLGCILTIIAGFTSSVHAQTLFQKYSGNPVFTVGGQPTWRDQHVANVTILNPSQTKDGKWRLFLRGTGNSHDQIGTFDQPAAGFNPNGPWSEYVSNPVIRNGPGTYDQQHCLDAAATSGPNKEVYLYYMGRSFANASSMNGAVSTDGGFTFTKFASNPLKMDVGPNDVVYNNNQYYLFYVDAKWNGSSFNEPLQIWLSQSSSPSAMSTTPSYALKVGPAGSFDSFSVNGAKIFKVSGDNRWFMLYQGSNINFDYPSRFHCAYSADLVNWTKVSNNTPLLERGNAGEWDQGGIWTGSVFENNGQLYVYYEAWGSYGTANRDQVYYSGGQSRVGVASCSTTNFLSWVNGNISACPGTNLVLNPGFEANGAATQTPINWSTWPGNTGTNADASFTETSGHSGTYRCTHFKATNYEVSTSQTLTGLKNGTYTLSAWVAGGGGQATAIMSAKGYGIGAPELTKPVPQSGWPNWSQISISGINVTNGNCTVGFYSNASASQWLSFDDVSFVCSSSGVITNSDLEESTKLSISVYPNPSEAELHIDFNIAETGVVKIYFTDLLSRVYLGQEQKAQIGNNQISVNTSHLPNGIYFVNILWQGKTLVKKIVINK